MVVCKCRKATKLYCFVHKTPVCGECICSNEHQICVVRTYSEWVIDGDYDWPPQCSICHGILQASDSMISRLGCLHVVHTTCLLTYLQSFPLHTAPAGYICPACSAPIWPPKSIKDYSSALSSKLKDVISQSGLSKTLLGNDVLAVQQAAPPPAFVSAPLVTFPNSSPAAQELIGSAKSNDGLPSGIGPQLNASATVGSSKVNDAETSDSGAEKEADELSGRVNGAHSSLTMASLPSIANATALQPGAMTRKNSLRSEKMGLAYTEFDSEDDDGGIRKYNRRGPLHKQAFKYLLPFWSNTLPTLPITAPSRKEDHASSNAEDLIEGRPRRRPRSSAVNIRKILLIFAIMSCMATMMLLYYRLLQGTASEDIENH